MLRRGLSLFYILGACRYLGGWIRVCSTPIGLTTTLNTSWNGGSQKHIMKNFALRSAFVLVMFFAFLGCSSDDDSDSTPTCPAGYTGSSCQIQLTPTKIKITKVVIKTFPLLNPDGDTWDNGEDTSGSNPDLFFVLSKIPGGGFYVENNYNIDSFLDDTFVMSTPIQITDINATFSLDLWDYDGGAVADSEFIETVYFTIYNDGDGFPASVVTTTSGNLVVEFFLTYEW